jgi:opacity protein-like surface antigen
MRHICAFLLFVSLGSAAVAQQGYPRAEVFGGYSYLHLDTQGVTSATLDSVCNSALGAGSCPAGTIQVHNGFNGWNGALQGNVNRWLGVAADFSGHYGTPVTISSQAQATLTALGILETVPKAKSYSYLFGPVISSRNKRITLFGHALLGVNDVSVTLSSGRVAGLVIPGLTASDNAFAGAFGGGADSRIASHLALRLQADYLLTKHDFSYGVQGIATHQNNVRISVGIVYRFETGVIPNATSARSSGTVIPALGVRVTTAASGGAEIVEVAPNGVAQLAGLNVEDVIHAVDGNTINSAMELAVKLTNLAPGTQVKLVYMVHGAWQTETVVILR